MCANVGNESLLANSLRFLLPLARQRMRVLAQRGKVCP